MAKKIGRKSSMNLRVLQKLEWSFKLGCSDREACNEAKIAPQTLYNYQLKNPSFLEQKVAWKSVPTFKARKAVINAFEKNPLLALRYLEKKLPKEFGYKTEIVSTYLPIPILNGINISTNVRTTSEDSASGTNEQV